MAEASLTVAYADVQIEVARLLGWDRTAGNWTATKNTDFSYILKKGLRQFYFPPSVEKDKPYYEWSFLRTLGTITLTALNTTYVLADNCSGTVLDHSVTYAVGSGRRRLDKVTESDLRSMQAVRNTTGWPKVYAVRNKAISNTGQRYEMLVYPTPTAVQANAVISYSYVTVPDVTGTTAIYHVGGGQYSELVLQSILAAAEEMIDDDANGQHAQKFQQLLSAAVRDDHNKKTPSTGGNV